MDLEPLLARFETEYLELNSISVPRRQQQAVFLRRLAESLDHPMTELTASDVQAFVGAELKRGLHPNTGRKYMGMLRPFVGWAYDAGLLDGQRTAELKLLRNPRGSTAQNRPRPYKTTEIRALYAQLGERYPVLPTYGRGSHLLRNLLAGRGRPGLRRELWRHAKRLQLEAQISLALELGLRRVEIHSLTIHAVHYDNDQVVALSAKSGPGQQPVRPIPYTSHSREAVREWLDFRSLLGVGHDSPWLLLPVQGNTLRQVEPQTLASLGGSLSRIGPWSWHRLRHTAATEWLRSGVPLEKVRIYMGHSNLDQTLAYAQIVGSDVDAAFGKAEADFAKRLGLAA